MFKVSFLALRKGDDRATPRQITIHDQMAVIGREASDLILDDHLVSRQHVAVVVQNNEIIVRDLNSRNGMYVNARRVLEQPLKLGDKLNVGSYQLMVTEIETDNEPVAPRKGEHTVVAEPQETYEEQQPTSASAAKEKKTAVAGRAGAFASLAQVKSQKR